MALSGVSAITLWMVIDRWDRDILVIDNFR
jgi:hypothetical protein